MARFLGTKPLALAAFADGLLRIKTRRYVVD